MSVSGGQRWLPGSRDCSCYESRHPTSNELASPVATIGTVEPLPSVERVVGEFKSLDVRVSSHGGSECDFDAVDV